MCAWFSILHTYTRKYFVYISLTFTLDKVYVVWAMYHALSFKLKMFVEVSRDIKINPTDLDTQSRVKANQ